MHDLADDFADDFAQYADPGAEPAFGSPSAGRRIPYRPRVATCTGCAWGPYGPFAAQDFGWNVSVSVRHVVLRCSPSQSAALAVYINAYPTRPSTTNPRSMVRYFVPPSV